MIEGYDFTTGTLIWTLSGSDIPLENLDDYFEYDDKRNTIILFDQTGKSIEFNLSVSL